ncbi:protein-glutamine glutaminase family protein [Kitasatospora sp. NPDC002543]
MLPPGLAKFFSIATGMKWPEADEDRLRAAGDDYLAIAKEVPELRDWLRRLLATVHDNDEFAGEAADRFYQRVLPLIGGTGGTDYVTSAGVMAKQLGDFAHKVANQVEYAKWMIIAQLIQLVAQIAWAIAMLPFTFGGSIAGVFAAYKLTGELIKQIFIWLLKQLLLHEFLSITTAAVMDGIIQGIQIGKGHKDHWESESFVQAVEMGAINGLLTGPLELLTFGLGKAFGRMLGRGLSKELQADLKALAGAEFKSLTENELKSLGTAELREVVKLLRNDANLTLKNAIKTVENKAAKTAAESAESALGSAVRNAEKNAAGNAEKGALKGAAGNAEKSAVKGAAESAEKSAAKEAAETVGQDAAKEGEKQLTKVEKITQQMGETFEQHLTQLGVDPQVSNAAGRLLVARIAGEGARYTIDLGTFNKLVTTLVQASGKTESGAIRAELGSLVKNIGPMQKELQQLGGTTLEGGLKESVRATKDLAERAVALMEGLHPQTAGQLLYRLGEGVGGYLKGGVQNVVTEGAYNLTFGEDHTFTVSVESFYGGVAMGALGHLGHLAADPLRLKFENVTLPNALRFPLAVVSTLMGHPTSLWVSRPEGAGAGGLGHGTGLPEGIRPENLKLDSDGSLAPSGDKSAKPPASTSANTPVRTTGGDAAKTPSGSSKPTPGSTEVEPPKPTAVVGGPKEQPKQTSEPVPEPVTAPTHTTPPKPEAPVHVPTTGEPPKPPQQHEAGGHQSTPENQNAGHRTPDPRQNEHREPVESGDSGPLRYLDVGDDSHIPPTAGHFLPHTGPERQPGWVAGAEPSAHVLAVLEKLPVDATRYTVVIHTDGSGEPMPPADLAAVVRGLGDLGHLSGNRRTIEFVSCDLDAGPNHGYVRQVMDQVWSNPKYADLKAVAADGPVWVAPGFTDRGTMDTGPGTGHVVVARNVGFDADGRPVVEGGGNWHEYSKGDGTDGPKVRTYPSDPPAHYTPGEVDPRRPAMEGTARFGEEKPPGPKVLRTTRWATVDGTFRNVPVPYDRVSVGGRRMGPAEIEAWLDAGGRPLVAGDRSALVQRFLEDAPRTDYRHGGQEEFLADVYRFASYERRREHVEAMEAVERTAKLVVETYPPEEYFYLGLGRSPAGVVAYLHEQEHSAMSMPLSSFRPRPQDPMAVAGWGLVDALGRPNPVPGAAQLEHLKAAFDRELGALTADVLRGRKILMIDYVQGAQSLVAAQHYVQEHLRGRADLDSPVVEALAMHQEIDTSSVHRLVNAIAHPKERTVWRQLVGAPTEILNRRQEWLEKFHLLPLTEDGPAGAAGVKLGELLKNESFDGFAQFTSLKILEAHAQWVDGAVRQVTLPEGHFTLTDRQVREILSGTLAEHYNRTGERTASPELRAKLAEDFRNALRTEHKDRAGRLADELAAAYEDRGAVETPEAADRRAENMINRALTEQQSYDVLREELREYLDRREHGEPLGDFGSAVPGRWMGDVRLDATHRWHLAEAFSRFPARENSFTVAVHGGADGQPTRAGSPITPAEMARTLIELADRKVWNGTDALDFVVCDLGGGVGGHYVTEVMRLLGEKGLGTTATAPNGKVFFVPKVEGGSVAAGTGHLVVASHVGYDPSGRPVLVPGGEFLEFRRPTEQDPRPAPVPLGAHLGPNGHDGALPEGYGTVRTREELDPDRQLPGALAFADPPAHPAGPPGDGGNGGGTGAGTAPAYHFTEAPAHIRAEADGERAAQWRRTQRELQDTYEAKLSEAAENLRLDPDGSGHRREEEAERKLAEALDAPGRFPEGAPADLREAVTRRARAMLYTDLKARPADRERILGELDGLVRVAAVREGAVRVALQHFERTVGAWSAPRITHGGTGTAHTPDRIPEPVVDLVRHDFKERAEAEAARIYADAGSLTEAANTRAGQALRRLTEHVRAELDLHTDRATALAGARDLVERAGRDWYDRLSPADRELLDAAGAKERPELSRDSLQAVRDRLRERLTADFDRAAGPLDEATGRRRDRDEAVELFTRSLAEREAALPHEFAVQAVREAAIRRAVAEADKAADSWAGNSARKEFVERFGGEESDVLRAKATVLRELAGELDRAAAERVGDPEGLRTALDRLTDPAALNERLTHEAARLAVRRQATTEAQAAAREHGLTGSTADRLTEGHGDRVARAFDESFRSREWNAERHERWQESRRELTEELTEHVAFEHEAAPALRAAADGFDGLAARHALNEKLTEHHKGEYGDELFGRYRELWKLAHLDAAGWRAHERAHENAFGRRTSEPGAEETADRPVGDGALTVVNRPGAEPGDRPVERAQDRPVERPVERNEDESVALTADVPAPHDVPEPTDLLVPAQAPPIPPAAVPPTPLDPVRRTEVLDLVGELTGRAPDRSGLYMSSGRQVGYNQARHNSLADVKALADRLFELGALDQAPKERLDAEYQVAASKKAPDNTGQPIPSPGWTKWLRTKDLALVTPVVDAAADLLGGPLRPAHAERLGVRIGDGIGPGAANRPDDVRALVESLHARGRISDETRTRLLDPSDPDAPAVLREETLKLVADHLAGRLDLPAPDSGRRLLDSLDVLREEHGTITMTWQAAKTNSVFQQWALAHDGQAPPLDQGTTLNCWESLLLTAHRAGLLPREWIRGAYADHADDAWESHLRRRLFPHGSTSFDVGDPVRPFPRAGDIVVTGNSPKPDHVALATGTVNAEGVPMVWSFGVAGDAPETFGANELVLVPLDKVGLSLADFGPGPWFQENPAHTAPAPATQLAPPTPVRTVGHSTPDLQPPVPRPGDGRTAPRFVVESSFDVRRFDHGGPVTDLTVRIAIRDGDGHGSAPVWDKVVQGVEEYLNKPGYRLANGDRMHVTVLPAEQGQKAHLTVDLIGRGRPMDQKSWWPDAAPIDYAHEVSHQLGLRDEYRADGLTHRPDVKGSLLGNHYAPAPAGLNQGGLRERHLSLISRIVGDVERPPTSGPKDLTWQQARDAAAPQERSHVWVDPVSRPKPPGRGGDQESVAPRLNDADGNGEDGAADDTAGNTGDGAALQPQASVYDDLFGDDPYDQNGQLIQPPTGNVLTLEELLAGDLSVIPPADLAVSLAGLTLGPLPPATDHLVDTTVQLLEGLLATGLPDGAEVFGTLDLIDGNPNDYDRLVIRFAERNGGQDVVQVLHELAQLGILGHGAEADLLTRFGRTDVAPPDRLADVFRHPDALAVSGRLRTTLVEGEGPERVLATIQSLRGDLRDLWRVLGIYEQGALRPLLDEVRDRFPDATDLHAYVRNGELWEHPVVDEAGAMDLFQELSRLQYTGADGQSHRIPFDFPDNGCFDRAHLMAVRLTELGVSTQKVFVQYRTPTGGPALEVSTANAAAPIGGTGPQAVNWHYHVAVTVDVVLSGSDTPVPMVFDPSTADRPLLVDHWMALMGVGVGTSTHLGSRYADVVDRLTRGLNDPATETDGHGYPGAGANHYFVERETYFLTSANDTVQPGQLEPAGRSLRRSEQFFREHQTATTDDRRDEALSRRWDRIAAGTHNDHMADEGQRPELYRLQEVPPDGDCLYHAVNAVLTPQHGDATGLRRLVVEWMRQPENFAVVRPYTREFGTTIGRLARTIGETGNWNTAAGDLAPRVVASALGVRLHIHRTGQSDVVLDPLNGVAPTRTVHLQLDADHYSAWVPVSQKRGREDGDADGGDGDGGEGPATRKPKVESQPETDADSTPDDTAMETDASSSNPAQGTGTDTEMESAEQPSSGTSVRPAPPASGQNPQNGQNGQVVAPHVGLGGGGMPVPGPLHERVQALEHLSPEERRRLAADEAFLEGLRADLGAEDFAQAAARLLIDVDPRTHQPVAARRTAEELVARMLSNKELAERLVGEGVRVVVVPRDVPMTEVPGFPASGHTTADGRDWRVVRGAGGDLVVLVTEENLLGARTPQGPGAEHAEGYSSTAHELAHAIHEFGLTDAQKALVAKAFRERSDADALSALFGEESVTAWPDGGVHDGDGNRVGNYSAGDEHEFFAQLVTAYFGHNHGDDPSTGQPRNNGAEWVHENVRDLAPLLEELFGPDPQADRPESANQLGRTDAEEELFDGLREFMDSTLDIESILNPTVVVLQPTAEEPPPPLVPTPPARLQERGLSAYDVLVHLENLGGQHFESLVGRFTAALHGDAKAARTLAESLFGAETLRPTVSALSRGDVREVPFQAGRWSGEIRISAALGESRHLRALPNFEFEYGSEQQSTVGVSKDRLTQVNLGAQLRAKFGSARDLTETLGYQHGWMNGSSDAEASRTSARGKTVETAELFETPFTLTVEFLDARFQGAPGPWHTPQPIELPVTGHVAVPNRETANAEPAVEAHYTVPLEVSERRRLAGSHIVTDVWPLEPPRRRQGEENPDEIPMEELNRQPQAPSMGKFVAGFEEAAERYFGNRWPELRRRLLTELDLGTLQQELKGTMSGQKLTIVDDSPGGAAAVITIGSGTVARMRQVHTLPTTEFNISTATSRAHVEQTTTSKEWQVLPSSVANKADGGFVGGGGLGAKAGRDGVGLHGSGSDLGNGTKVKRPAVLFEGTADLTVTFGWSGGVLPHPAGETTHVGLGFRTVIDQDEAVLVTAADQVVAGTRPPEFVPDGPVAPPVAPAHAVGDQVPAPLEEVWTGLPDTTVVRDLRDIAPLHAELDRVGTTLLGAKAWKAVREDVLQSYSHSAVSAHLVGMSRGSVLRSPEVTKGPLKDLHLATTVRLHRMTHLRSQAAAELNPVRETGTFESSRHLRSDTVNGQFQLAGKGTVFTHDDVLKASGKPFESALQGTVVPSAESRIRDGWRSGESDKGYANGKYRSPQELYRAEFEVLLKVNGRDYGPVLLTTELSLEQAHTVPHTIGQDERNGFVVPPGLHEQVVTVPPQAPHRAGEQAGPPLRLGQSDVVLSLGRGDTAVLHTVLEALRTHTGKPVPANVEAQLARSIDAYGLKSALSRLSRGSTIRVPLDFNGWKGTVVVGGDLRHPRPREELLASFEFESGSQQRTTTGTTADLRTRFRLRTRLGVTLPYVNLTGEYAHTRDFVKGITIDRVGGTNSRGKSVEPARLTDVDAVFTVTFEAAKRSHTIAPPDPVTASAVVAAPVRVREEVPRMLSTHRFGSSDVITAVHLNQDRSGTVHDLVRDLGDTPYGNGDRTVAALLGEDWAGLARKLSARLDFDRLQLGLKSVMAGHPLVEEHGRTTAVITAEVVRLTPTGRPPQVEFNIGHSHQTSLTSSDGGTNTGGGSGHAFTGGFYVTGNPAGTGVGPVGGGALTYARGVDRLEHGNESIAGGTAIKSKVAAVAHQAEVVLKIRFEYKPPVLLYPADAVRPDRAPRPQGDDSVLGKVSLGLTRLGDRLTGFGRYRRALVEATLHTDVLMETGRDEAVLPSRHGAPTEGLPPLRVPQEVGALLLRRPPGSLFTEGVRDVGILRWIDDTSGVRDLLTVFGPRFFKKGTWSWLESVARNTQSHAQLSALFGSVTRGRQILHFEDGPDRDVMAPEGRSITTPSVGRRFLVDDADVTASVSIVQLEYQRDNTAAAISPANDTGGGGRHTRLDWSQWNLQVQAGAKAGLEGGVDLTGLLGGGGGRRWREGPSTGASGKTVAGAKFPEPTARYTGYAEVRLTFRDGDRTFTEKGLVPIEMEVPISETAELASAGHQRVLFTALHPEGETILRNSVSDAVADLLATPLPGAGDRVHLLADPATRASAEYHDLLEALRALPHDDPYFTVVFHGRPEDGAPLLNGEEVTPQQFAGSLLRLAEGGQWQGEPLRFLSCNSAVGGAGSFAGRTMKALHDLLEARRADAARTGQALGENLARLTDLTAYAGNGSVHLTGGADPRAVVARSVGFSADGRPLVDGSGDWLRLRVENDEVRTTPLGQELLRPEQEPVPHTTADDPIDPDQPAPVRLMDGQGAGPVAEEQADHDAGPLVAEGAGPVVPVDQDAAPPAPPAELPTWHVQRRRAWELLQPEALGGAETLKRLAYDYGTGTNALTALTERLFERPAETEARVVFTRPDGQDVMLTLRRGPDGWPEFKRPDETMEAVTIRTDLATPTTSILEVEGGTGDGNLVVEIRPDTHLWVSMTSDHVEGDELNQLGATTYTIRAENSGDMYHMRAALIAHPDRALLVWNVTESTRRQVEQIINLHDDLFIQGRRIHYTTDTTDPSGSAFRNETSASTDIATRMTRSIVGDHMRLTDALLPKEDRTQTTKNELAGMTRKLTEMQERLAGYRGRDEDGGEVSQRAARIAELGRAYGYYTQEEAEAFQRDLENPVLGRFEQGGKYVIVTYRDSGHSNRAGANAPGLDTGLEGVRQIIEEVQAAVGGGVRVVVMGEEPAGWDGPALQNYWNWPSVGNRRKELALLRYLADRYDIVGAVGMRSGVMDELAFAGIKIVSIDISPHRTEGDGLPNLKLSKGWTRGLRFEEAFWRHYGRAFITDPRADDTVYAEPGATTPVPFPGEFSARDLATIRDAVAFYLRDGQDTEEYRHSSHPHAQDRVQEALDLLGPIQDMSGLELARRTLPYLREFESFSAKLPEGVWDMMRPRLEEAEDAADEYRTRATENCRRDVDGFPEGLRALGVTAASDLLAKVGPEPISAQHPIAEVGPLFIKAIREALLKGAVGEAKAWVKAATPEQLRAVLRTCLVEYRGFP